LRRLPVVGSGIDALTCALLALRSDSMSETEDYFLDYYGKCNLDPCLCIPSVKNEDGRFGGAWVGRKCPDWVPLGAKNFDELMEWMRNRDKKNE